MKDLPEGWEWKKLGEICDIKSGNSAPQGEEYFNDGKYPFIRVKHISTLKDGKYVNDCDLINEKCLKEKRFNLFPKNSIVFPKSGMSLFLNRKAMLKEGSYVVGHLAILIPNTAIIFPEYLFYWAQTIHFSDLSHSTTLPSIKISLIEDVEVPLPPLPVQHKIVAILERAETLKRKRAEASEMTRRIAQAVFLEMFGDPVRNPKRWVETTINDVAVKEKGAIRMGPFGSQLKKPELTDAGIRVLWIENIVDNEFDFKVGKFITEEKYSQLKGFTIKPKNVIMTMMGTIGRVAVVPDNIGIAIISSHLLKIEVDYSKCNSTFLKHMILSNYVQKQFARASHGIVMGGLNTKIVKDTKIFLPPLLLQDKFAEAINNIEKVKEKQQKSEQDITLLFDSLMQRAFNGELAS